MLRFSGFQPNPGLQEILQFVQVYLLIAVLIGPPFQSADEVEGKHAPASVPLGAFLRKFIRLAGQDFDLVRKAFHEFGSGGFPAADFFAGERARMAGVGNDEYFNVLIRHFADDVVVEVRQINGVEAIVVFWGVVGQQVAFFLLVFGFHIAVAGKIDNGLVAGLRIL